MSKIVLVGYMGVGKSTIANLLSQKLHFDYVDIDDLIERKEGLSIADIFKSRGEIYFRKIEHEVFKTNIKNQGDLIISTGGGTPCYANNHLFFNEPGVVSFYMKASLQLLVERLKNTGDERPIIAGKSEEELSEFVAKHLFERSYFYNYAAYTVSVDGKSPETIADEVIHLLS